MWWLGLLAGYVSLVTVVFAAACLRGWWRYRRIDAAAQLRRLAEEPDPGFVWTDDDDRRVREFAAFLARESEGEVE